VSSKAARSPKVSIGLPVYNGERFLPQAVDSLLNQDFSDLELVISDNGSDDGTEKLCRDYVASDPRVRYERQPVNRGASWNFNRVLEIADPGAEYFTWAAADDERSPSYLTRTVAILDSDRSISLAHTGSVDIDEEGYVLHVWDQQVAQLASHDVAVRIRDLLTINHECFPAFGVIRQDIARATRGLGPYTDADNVLLLEIALRGRFVHDPEPLFQRRQHSFRSMVHFTDRHERIAWFDPGKAGKVTFPMWRVGRECLLAIERAPLTADERRRCYASMSVFLRCNWPSLAKTGVRSGLRLGAQRTRALRHGRSATGAGAPPNIPVIEEDVS
jgi:glycosyltransferase involved in cell wall biosynthesis